MQNRGLVKFFAILFALVSIYQLSFTFVAHNVESDAKAFANGNSEKELKYLDSIGKEKVMNLGFSDFTYNEVKDKKINKGLDLEDGKANVDLLAYSDIKDKTQIGIELHSGRNRIVRRIFEHLGYEVKSLDRVTFAGLKKKNVDRGKCRFLTEKEIRDLKYFGKGKR